MQAHTQAEFKASIQESVIAADRTKDGRWFPLTRETTLDGKCFFHVNGTPQDRNDPNSGHNFTTDPWSRHLVQLEGQNIPAFVITCKCASDHVATLSFMEPIRGVSGIRVRSLGYVGSFIREYESAARLLRFKATNNELLKIVSSPGRKDTPEGGSFVPVTSIRNIDTSRVPLSTAQSKAVLALNGGLDIIVGPPGDGDNLTLIHFYVNRDFVLTSSIYPRFSFSVEEPTSVSVPGNIWFQPSAFRASQAQGSLRRSITSLAHVWPKIRAFLLHLFGIKLWMPWLPKWPTSECW